MMKLSYAGDTSVVVVPNRTTGNVPGAVEMSTVTTRLFERTCVKSTYCSNTSCVCMCDCGLPLALFQGGVEVDDVHTYISDNIYILHTQIPKW
jgi:hypothetical protein